MKLSEINFMKIYRYNFTKASGRAFFSAIAAPLAP